MRVGIGTVSEQNTLSSAPSNFSGLDTTSKNIAHALKYFVKNPFLLLLHPCLQMALLAMSVDNFSTGLAVLEIFPPPIQDWKTAQICLQLSKQAANDHLLALGCFQCV